MRTIAVVVAVVVVLAALGFAYAASKPAGVTVPKYTVISVVLDDTISSKKNVTGDKFEAHCVGANCGGFPSMTTFIGVLTITPAKGSNPARGSAKFFEAVLPDERRIDILAEPSSPEGVKKGERVGEVSKSKERKTGTAVGAGVGAIVAGGHGGTVIGAGVGYLAGKSSKGTGKNIELKAGSHGHIVILRPVTIPPPPKKE